MVTFLNREDDAALKKRVEEIRARSEAEFKRYQADIRRMEFERTKPGSFADSEDARRVQKISGQPRRTPGYFRWDPSTFFKVVDQERPQPSNIFKTKRLMETPPAPISSPRTSGNKAQAEYYGRVKTPEGQFEDKPLVLGERPTAPKPGIVESLKVVKETGGVYVNGEYAPQLTNTLRSMAQGKIPAPDPILKTYGERNPFFTGIGPKLPDYVDGIKVTRTLLQHYVDTLATETLKPLGAGEIEPGRIFTEEGAISPTGSKPPLASLPPEPTIYNAKDIRKRLYRTIGDKPMNITDLPPNTIYVGRAFNKGNYQLDGSKWGNPFRVDKDGNIDEVLSKYKNWAKDQIKKNPGWLDPLVGKDLVDWCAPGKCHADVLKDLIKEEYGGFSGSKPLVDSEARKLRINELETIRREKGMAGLTKEQQQELTDLKKGAAVARTPVTQMADEPFRKIEAERFEAEREAQNISNESDEYAQKRYPKNSDSPRFKIQPIAVGDVKVPGIYIDGMYNSNLTYGLVNTLNQIQGNERLQSILKKQGGFNISGVFVSETEMQKFLKSMPTGQEVLYSEKDNPTVKSGVKGSRSFGIANKGFTALAILDAVSLYKQLKEILGPRKVPTT